MRRYVLALVIALVIAAGLYVYAAYTATYSAMVADGSRDLSNGEIAILASGSFIARWYVVLLVGAALTVSRQFGRGARTGGA